MARKLTNIHLMVILVPAIGTFLARPLVEQGIYRIWPDYELAMGASKGDTDMLDQALRYGAEVNLQSRHSYAHRTALMAAAMHGRVEAAQFLLARGANAGMRDDKGLTARDLAIQSHHPDVANLLTGHVKP